MEDRRKYVRQKQLEYEAERRAREAEEWARAKLGQAGRNLAGNAAGTAGVVAGVGRGIYNDAKAIKDGAVYVHDLASFGSPRQAAAVAAGRQALDNGIDYVSTRSAAPSLLKRDVQRVGLQLNRDLNPNATAPAPTVGAEMARRFGVGMNQGEAAYNVASLVLPVVGEVKSAAQLGRIGRLAEAGPAKYVEMGATPNQAARFSLPYNGVGHHAYIPRDATWAKVPGVKRAADLLGIPEQKLSAPVPKRLVDSRFNVVKPKVETGLFYKRHAGIHYGGGKLPNEFGGERWSAKKLGWTKFNPVERAWYGMPGATKGIVVGVPATLGAAGAVKSNDKSRR